MRLSKFKLEEYFAKYEFNTSYTLGSSDPETISLSELVNMADSECRKLWRQLRLGYTKTYGHPILREEISQLYKAVEQDNIVVCAGAEEAIYVTLQVVVKRDDEVIIVTPCYQSLKEIPLALGAKVSEFSLEYRGNKGWFFDLEKFKSMINLKTKLVILNFPHNPTGYLPSPSLFGEILELIKSYNITLFSDEVYRLSEQNPSSRLPNAIDEYENAISLGVISKSYGLPGLRIGWIAAKNKDLIKQIAGYKNYTSISNSAPSEILTLIALRNKDKILKRTRQIARYNLDLLDNFFNAYKAYFNWNRPIAGALFHFQN